MQETYKQQGVGCRYPSRRNRPRHKKSFFIQKCSNKTCEEDQGKKSESKDPAELHMGIR